MAESEPVEAGEGGLGSPSSPSRGRPSRQSSQAEQPLAARSPSSMSILPPTFMVGQQREETPTPPGERARAHGHHRRRPREKKWSFRRVMRASGKKKNNEPESDEDDELRPEPSFWEDASETACLSHKDNIYTFMLFMPAYHRRKNRHYCSSEVFIALMLLLLNISLQVGLILIAGGHLHKQKIQFTGTLVRIAEYYDFPTATPLDDFAAKGVDTVRDYVDTIKTKFMPPKAETKCCDGARCSELKMACCDRSHLKDALNTGSSGVNGTRFSEEEEGEHEILTNQLAICVRSESKLDCTPPNFRFVEAWNELDTDGDGMWSIEEARTDAGNLGCRYGVPTEEIFRSACRGIVKDAEDTASNSFTIPLIPMTIENRLAIPKDYFTWWVGLTALCVGTDASRCSEFVAMGFFDAAIKLKSRVSRGGIADLDTALDYCQRWLRRGGICEKTLPSSYLMYRARVEEKCGDPIYSAGDKFVNPYDHKDVMTTVAVGYSNYNQYAQAILFKFKLFVWLILMVWYVNLVGEAMELIRFADFLWNIRTDDRFTLITPGVRSWLRSNVSDQEVDSVPRYGSFTGSFTLSETLKKSISKGVLSSPASTPRDPKTPPAPPNEDDTEFEMTGMSHIHYYICAVTFFVRTFLFWYIMQTGTVYLLNNYEYDDLLMNAVALAFIFEVPEALYWFLVPDGVKSQFEGARTCEYETALPTHGAGRIVVSRTFLGLILVPPIVTSVVIFNLHHHIIPSLDALSCTCFQEGDACGTAAKFSKAWWDSYWMNTTELAVERAGWIHSTGG